MLARPLFCAAVARPATVRARAALATAAPLRLLHSVAPLRNEHSDFAPKSKVVPDKDIMEQIEEVHTAPAGFLAPPSPSSQLTSAMPPTFHAALAKRN
jgi:hypothetical protein